MHHFAPIRASTYAFHWDAAEPGPQRSPLSFTREDFDLQLVPFVLLMLQMAISAINTGALPFHTRVR
jgi:hypothetical protein